MLPDFELFGRTISTYPLVAVIGVLLAGVFACRVAKKRGYDDNTMIMFLLVAGIGAIIGSHLLYAMTNSGYIYLLFENGFKGVDSLEKVWQLLVLIFGGSVFYGGLIGGTLAGIIYAKKKKLNLGAYSDMVAPAVPLLHTFGRIGCFLGGCCYGVEAAFGFTYTRSLVEAANGVSRFPIQLVEAAFNLVLFFILWALLRKNLLKDRLFLLYLLLYSVGRFILEFWRGDEYRGFVFGALSTSQFISILIFVTAAVLFILKSRTKPADNQ